MEVLKKTGTVLLLDILSILCIPIFLAGMLFKMLAAVVRKFIFFPIVAIVVLWFAVIYNAFNNGIGRTEDFFMLIVQILGMGILTSIIHFAHAIIMVFSTAVSSIFDVVGGVISGVYVSIVEFMRGKFQALGLFTGDAGKKAVAILCCFPFLLLYGIYFLLKTIIKHCSVLGVIVSVGIVVRNWSSLSAVSREVIGVDFGSFAKMFDTKDSIMNWIQLVGILVVQIAVVMFISIEWSQAALELEDTNVDNSLRACFAAPGDADLDGEVLEVLETETL